jgi:prepilin-type N-terminal cleavage/methylation domain-containing protein
MLIKHSSKGFTLIEVIIYIALFSILIGGAFIVAFQLIDSSGKLNAKNTVQSEGNFVMRKLSWALTSVDPGITTTPSLGTTSNLRVTKYDGTKVEICFDSNKIKIHEGTFSSCTDSDYLPITTDNVTVKTGSLNFTFIPATGSGPFGITASFTITQNGVDFPFTITKYIRK